MFAENIYIHICTHTCIIKNITILKTKFNTRYNCNLPLKDLCVKYWKNFKLISYTEITKVHNDYSWHEEPTMEMARGDLPHALTNHMAFSFFVHKIYIGKNN